MSLQGSIHKWSDGIGYGAYVPPERVYYNDRKPTSKRLRRASSERTNYRRQNATAGVDTHRSDISFGKTLDSIKTGEEGNSRAREATTFLTSGEVGNFCWPAEQARSGADGDVIFRVVSSKESLPTHARSYGGQQNVGASVEATVEGDREGRQKQNQSIVVGSCMMTTARSLSTSSNNSGGFTRRSNSSTVTSSVSHKSSRTSSSPRSARCCECSCSSNGDSQQTMRTNPPGIISNRSCKLSSTSSGSKRENRLRSRLIVDGEAPLQCLPQQSDLDPVFSKHRKYDLIAHRREAQGREVTGRFGSVNLDSVMAGSQLNSELSTPWSHVLRGQKW